MSREFAEKPQPVPGHFVSQPLESTRKSKKFPVFSLLIREFDRRDGFDRDCVIRQPVSDFSVSLRMNDRWHEARCPSTPAPGTGGTIFPNGDRSARPLGAP